MSRTRRTLLAICAASICACGGDAKAPPPQESFPQSMTVVAGGAVYSYDCAYSKGSESAAGMSGPVLDTADSGTGLSCTQSPSVGFPRISLEVLLAAPITVSYDLSQDNTASVHVTASVGPTRYSSVFLDQSQSWARVPGTSGVVQISPAKVDPASGKPTQWRIQLYMVRLPIADTTVLGSPDAVTFDAVLLYEPST